MPRWYCPQCKREFGSTHHFTSHHSGRNNAKCKQLYELDRQVRPNGRYDPNRKNQLWPNPVLQQPEPASPRHDGALDNSNNDNMDEDGNSNVMLDDDEPMDVDHSGHTDDEEEEDYDVMPDMSPDAESDSEDEEEDDKAPPLPQMDPLLPPKSQTTNNLRFQFRQYVATAKKDFVFLPPEIEAAMELMSILDKEGAPLSAYDKILEWHLTHLDYQQRITKDKLLKKLRDRYNMKDTKAYELPVTLPSSGVKLKVPCHNFEVMLRDLLTDPQIRDDDYLFFGDDPTNPMPPDSEWNEIRDVNTGLAYRETYKKLIQPNPVAPSGRTKVLCPVVLYMDGCVTGTFENLSLEILKFTLGIFRGSSRIRKGFWRNLGAVPTYEKAKAGAREYIQGSSHAEAADYLTDSDSEDDEEQYGELKGDSGNCKAKSGKNNPRPDGVYRPFDVTHYIDDDAENEGDYDEDYDAIFDPQMPEIDAQDLHYILNAILGSYKVVQGTDGIEWDLFYKGTLYRLLFIPFVAYVKGDSVEADKHCGKYGSRTRYIKQLCRFCCCPNAETDQAYVDHEPKTQTMMCELVRDKDTDTLKLLSQNYIWNAWYDIRFGLHNDHGIHGATPLDATHYIQLGTYKYDREMLFQQTGHGKLGDAFNICCTHMGWLFQRQSDKRYPRTKFTSGIIKGKLMAHEHTGLILVMAAAMRSTKGRNILLNETWGKQADFFPEQSWIEDWLLMLETHLQQEAWMKCSSLPVQQVKRHKMKVKEVMNMTKIVGKRQKGMQFRTFNFHAAKHLAEQILHFGVPEYANTKSDEEHHKGDKKATGRTQKRPKTFDFQSLERIDDIRVIEMGMAEYNQGLRRWNYFERVWHDEGLTLAESAKREPDLTGVKATFWYEEAENDAESCWKYTLHTQMANKRKYKFQPQVLSAIKDVGNEVSDYLEEIKVHSELQVPNEDKSWQTYRASPHFMGKPWYDWAMLCVRDNVNHPDAVMPGHIRAFIDLRDLPQDNLSGYKPSIYMIVETVKRNADPEETNFTSQLFEPYLKKRARVKGTNRWAKAVEIICLDKLEGPACVIPDLDNKHESAFIRVLPWHEWAELFGAWLDYEHTQEFDEPQSLTQR